MGFVGEGGEGGEPATEPGDEERAEKDGIGVLALAPNGEECNEEGANHVYHERNDPAWQHGCVGCGLPNAVAKRGARSSTYCNVKKAYHFLRKTIAGWFRLLRSFTENSRANVDKFPKAIERPSFGRNEKRPVFGVALRYHWIGQNKSSAGINARRRFILQGDLP